MKRTVVMFLAVLAVGVRVDATPITYEFTGVASGDLNGASFTDTAFRFTLTGDTANVQDLGGGLFHNVASSVEFAIAGVGSGTMTDVYRLFSNQTVPGVGFGHLFGFDRVDALGNPEFSTYDLTTAFPLILADFFFVGQFNDDPTTAGPLNLTSGGDVTFQATIGAAVPEPGSLALLGLGVAGFGAYRRRKAMKNTAA